MSKVTTFCTFEELKDRIIHNYDIDLVVELLDLSVADLLARFEDVLEARIHMFEDLLQEDSTDETYET